MRDSSARGADRLGHQGVELAHAEGLGQHAGDSGPPETLADLIRRARTPLRTAELGRDSSKPLRRDWERVKDDVMRRAVTTKVLAHVDIRELLLSTGDEEIVEDTTTDHYWGRGRTGNGRNMLGKILMRTRSRLRAEQAGKDGRHDR